MICKICGSENTILINMQTKLSPTISIFAKDYDLPVKIVQKIKCNECNNKFEV